MSNGITHVMIARLNAYQVQRSKVLEVISPVELQGLYNQYPDMNAGYMNGTMTRRMIDRGHKAFCEWEKWMKTDECLEILNRPKKLRYLRNG